MLQERHTRRKFLGDIARLGAGLALSHYPILGYGSQDTRQKLETPYDAPQPPLDGYVEFGGYNYMRKHNWALNALIKDALDGKIPLAQNTLIHIDAHHDVCDTLGCMEMSKDVMNLLKEPTSYEKMLGVIEEETRKTSPGEWLIKLFAAGLINEVLWARPQWDFRERDQPPETFYTLEQWPGADHIYKVIRSRIKAEMKGAKNLLTVREISAEEILRHADRLGAILYDADLDYFSCCGQGAPEWVNIREFERVEKVPADWYELRYGKRLERQGDIMRNPLRKVYKASLPEIEREMSVIKDVEKALPKDRPSSRTLAVSPDFLFSDQQDFIIESFLG